MSSQPVGLRFSPFASPATASNNTNNGICSPGHVQSASTGGSVSGGNGGSGGGGGGNNTINSGAMPQSQQQQPQQQVTTVTGKKSAAPPPSAQQSLIFQTSLSGSETDLSTSTENLSLEERYVLRHTARVEPQGQENFQEVVPPVNENNQMLGRFVADPQARFSSATSNDSTRYASSTRSMSETRQQQPVYASAPISAQQTSQNAPSIGSVSNRNSLIKESNNSNRSSMDVSTCSYNTLIIHNDDQSMYGSMARDYQSTPTLMVKKERPRSYGEQGMQEITEIPDDYLNQSHVLKHLAKEMTKNPAANRRSSSSTNTATTTPPSPTKRDSGVVSEKDAERKERKEPPPKYGVWNSDEQALAAKAKSKSQPNLHRLADIDLDAVEALVKENGLLKHQLATCLSKVARTQKLEDEVTNIYRVHEELVQSSERREKLERAARMRLQSELQRVQELNRALKDQVEIFQSQLMAPSEHSTKIMIAQLFTQNKELSAAKERQDIELAAQRATLQEQRNHIGILDTALTNAQHNIRRLEEEIRKKQMYIERIAQLQQHTQNDRKLRIDYDSELSKDSNRSGSSTNSDTKWQIQEKNNQLLRLENEVGKIEQRHLEETALRQNAAKLAAIEKNSQETDRIIAEAKNDKLRYLEEVHAAQRRVNDLQTHLKLLESRLAEKDALIRALQGQKICGSSFDSYNLSTDSFTLSPLKCYNSQASFAVSNTSSSLLDSPGYGPNSMSGGYVSVVGQTHVPCYPSTPSYQQSALNLHQTNGNGGVGGVGGVSVGNGVSGVGVNGSNVVGGPFGSVLVVEHPSSSSYESQYEVARKSIDDHMKKQFDEQLSKRGLCCFPSLSTKKPIQPLLADEVSSVLSTNNSDAFLQKLAHIDQQQRERDRQQEQQQQHQHQDQMQGPGLGGLSSLPGSLGSATSTMSNPTKTEEIVLLEKQGRCSQKIRNNSATMGNLAQVSHSVGQNMTDISNIGGVLASTAASKMPKIVQNLQAAIALPSSRKDRGSSLPPSALPRPPRSLKQPRKIEYDRLSDSELRRRAQTPPQALVKRRDYSPSNAGAYIEMQEAMAFAKPTFVLGKHKDYGTTSTGGGRTSFTSSKNSYQRLEDPPKSPELSMLKRSLLPSARKMHIASLPSGRKSSRDSTSSGSNNSRESTGTVNMTYNAHGNGYGPPPSPVATALPMIQHRHHSKTPPKYITLGVPLPPPSSSPAPGGIGKLSALPIAGHHSHHPHHHLHYASHHLHRHPTDDVPPPPLQPRGVSVSASLPPKRSSAEAAKVATATAISGGSGPASSSSSGHSTGRRGSSLTRATENRYRIQF